jgi:hypothetical protein
MFIFSLQRLSRTLRILNSIALKRVGVWALPPVLVEDLQAWQPPLVGVLLKMQPAALSCIPVLLRYLRWDLYLKPLISLLQNGRANWPIIGAMGFLRL